MGDLSPRALAALKAADAVLCEDSRTTGAMLTRLGVAARLIPLHDHNEANELPRLLAMLQQGQKLALVSDAGTPLVSDPGFRLVRAAIAEDKARLAGLDEDERPQVETAPGGGKRPFVSLAQRAAPLLELLEWAEKKAKPVTWGT